MLCLKKLYTDELLQIALLVSILRVNQEAIFDVDIYGDVNDLNFDNGTSFSRLTPSVIRSQFIHPKSLDNVLLNYERELFADLNSLGRFNNYRHQNISAYLLNIDRNTSPLAEPEGLAVPSVLADSNHSQDAVSRGLVENDGSLNLDGDGLDLTQEDMELIEVLWKQDVDLGFSLENANGDPKLETAGDASDKKIDFEEFVTNEFVSEDDLKPCTSLPKFTDDKILKVEPKDEQKEEDDDLWAGVDYTIDTETGEYVIKGENEPVPNATDLEDLSLPLPEFLLDEALSLVELDDEQTPQNATADLKPVSNLTGEEDDFDRDFDLFSEMIQAPQFHHPHHRAAFHQGRMPSFVRTVSMEQRWQDLANLLSLPSGGEGGATMPHPFGPHHALHNYTHHHHHGLAAAAAAYGVPDARGVLLHNATLPTPMGDLNAGHYSNHHLGGTIGNAVATSMNLTNSSEPMGEPSAPPHYKMEPSSDIMPYYPNNFSEVASNQTDGFLSSILNDEDLQLMDMAMNEGMYTMRMLDANQTSAHSMNSTSASTSKNDMERLDTSSDSAVSSMGSERVPSLSDGEWCDAGSDSGHTTNGEHFYNYTNRQLPESTRIPLVAQKKHQMYGKRYFQDQASSCTSVHHHPTPIKYEYRDPTIPSYSVPPQPEPMPSKSQDVKYFCGSDFGHTSRSPLDHAQHNHTYHLPAENNGPLQRPISRDKIRIRKSEDEHLTRDEKRAKAMNIPITVDDIINLPMDEFNERLSKYDLSETQLSLIRDIRRRGKNKVAAQNCRKRKLDQIMHLADEVREMRDRKLKLVNDHKYACAEVKRRKEKFQQLYRHVFQNLRDPDGNQYSPYQYSLQTAADGSMVMVPKDNNHPHSSKD